MERSPDALRPTVMAALNGAFAVPYVIMPIISTRVQESVGFGPLFVATGCFYLLAMGAIYLLFLRPLLRPRATAHVN
jgi:hypothetical protein